jgi:hypothetical protein
MLINTEFHPFNRYISLVFFHTPKSGGSTVNELIVNSGVYNRPFHGRTILNYIVETPEKMSKYDFFSGHITHDCLPLLPSNFFGFTFLRQPINRVMSLYSYFREMDLAYTDLLSDRIQVEAISLAKELTIMGWLINDSRNPFVSVLTENSVARQFVPSSFFDHNNAAAPEVIVSTFKKFINTHCQFVGFQETFFQDIYRLFDILSLPKPTTIPLLNSSRALFSTSDVHDVTDWCQTHNRLDSELYAWSLEKFSKAIPVI